MEITKYASQSCVKCKVLDRTLKTVKLPCDVNVLYVEDNRELFEQKGIDQLPTLEFKVEGKDPIYLEGLCSPKQINEVIESLN